MCGNSARNQNLAEGCRSPIKLSHGLTSAKMTSREHRVVVLISGSGKPRTSGIRHPSDPNRHPGTNLQALIDAQGTQSLPNTNIVLVLSNRKAAYGLTRARNADPPIPTQVLALQPYLKANPGKTRDDYDCEVSKIVLAASPDLVVLAGWMHVFSDTFLKEVEREDVPVINIHPALPGAFDGVNSVQRAFDAFGRGEIDHSGVMVHKVIREVDRGEPILVRKVEIKKEDSLEDFEQRLHQTEWGVIVEATKNVLESHR